MPLRLLYISLLVSLSAVAVAHNTYFVYLSDKHLTPYSLTEPEHYLSTRALERRQRQHIAIDSTDLPVSPVYLDSLRHLGAHILHTTRWLNGVSLEADETTIETIRQLCFVDSVQRTKTDNGTPTPAPKRLPSVITETHDSFSAQWQSRQLFLHLLHEAGFRGQGMRIAIVDNGFLNIDLIEGMSHALSQITDTFNLVPTNGELYGSGAHGTYVTSIIAGLIEDEYEGGATEAEYVLIRSEDDLTESLLEVDNQVRAFELADSTGADIINSSLGYYFFDDTTTNLSYSDLDGRHARNSIAATMAARKGMVVCIAAGNERQNTWHYIDTPADADSILAVGSVNAEAQSSSFSSVGPTADGRVKPDIAAMGERAYVISTDGRISQGNGTSFASPLIAAAAACLWQALPELNNIELIRRIELFASQALTPDTLIGYGIPNLWDSYLITTDLDLTTDLDNITTRNNPYSYNSNNNPYNSNNSSNNNSSNNSSSSNNNSNSNNSSNNNNSSSSSSSLLYDLLGRPLSAPTATPTTPGIYITNGRKKIVR